MDKDMLLKSLFKSAEECSKKISHLEDMIWQLEKENVIRIQVKVETSYGRTSEPVFININQSKIQKEIVDSCLEELKIVKDRESSDLSMYKDKLRNEIDNI